VIHFVAFLQPLADALYTTNQSARSYCAFLYFRVNQSRKYAWKHRAEFCEFGAVAVLLEMTPVLNLLFFWTNVVGEQKETPQPFTHFYGPVLCLATLWENAP